MFRLGPLALWPTEGHFGCFFCRLFYREPGKPSPALNANLCFRPSQDFFFLPRSVFAVPNLVERLLVDRFWFFFFLLYFSVFCLNTVLETNRFPLSFGFHSFLCLKSDDSTERLPPPSSFFPLQGAMAFFFATLLFECSNLFVRFLFSF